MDEYIKREAIRDALYDADAITMEGVKIINQLPPSDVEPIRHGHWVKEATDTFGFDEADYHCSECRRRPVEDVLTMYCPRCGAKMDETEWLR